MTEVPTRQVKRRELLNTAGQLAAFLAGIAAVFLAVTGFLTFMADKCEAGAPFMPQVFVCFPPR